MVVVDEADACFEEQPAAMAALLAGACSQAERPSVALVGATLNQDLCKRAADEVWLQYPVQVESPSPGSLPPGLQHRHALTAGMGMCKVCDCACPSALNKLVVQVCSGARGHGGGLCACKVATY